MNFERKYAQALQRILNEGIQSGDRTGTGTIRLPHASFEIDYSKDGFPALKAKKVIIKNAFVESVWMVTGQQNTKFLKKNGVNYWDDWAKPNGDLGPVYGAQMRNFNGVDQLEKIVKEIKTNPNSRRLVISLWNVNELPNMQLEPCHILYQFTVIDNKISLHVFQRSADMFLGVPYDFMLFAFIHKFVADMTGTILDKMYYTIGDAHIYQNHLEQVTEYLSRVNEESNNELIDSKLEFDVDFTPNYGDTLHGTDNYGNQVDPKKLDSYFIDYLNNLEVNIKNYHNSFDTYKSLKFIKAPIAV